MGKKLSEMTLDELWQLFPIELTEHQSEWAEQYSEMEASLKSILSSCRVARISHIGSTAIDGIWAKPTIDVLIEIEDDEDIDVVADLLEQNGFNKMCKGERRVSLTVGYTEEGFADKVFHVHLRFLGDNDELYFRDYLKDHAVVAREYEKLKLDLWHRFEHNRDAYTDAKGDFIKRYTNEAKSLYGNRY